MRVVLARQLEDALDDFVNPLRVVLDDLDHAPVGGRQIGGFIEQLRGMTDRAQRVADLVRDTGGQSAQRCQLELLDLGRQLCRVLEYDQRALGVVVADRGEAGAQITSARHGAEIRLMHVRRLQPLPVLAGQRWRGFLQRVVAHRDRHAEQHPRDLVHHLDGFLFIDDQDAGTHLLNDIVVELRQAGEIGTALIGQLLALGRPRAEPVGQQREGEERYAEQTGLHVGGLGKCAAHVRIDALGEHGQRGEGGEQQRGVTDLAETAECDRYGDQHADPGLHAATGVHHHGDQHDIDEYRGLSLFVAVFRLTQVDQQRNDGESEVQMHRDGKNARQVGTQGPAADSEISQQQCHAERDPVDQIEPQVVVVAPVLHRWGGSIGPDCRFGRVQDVAGPSCLNNYSGMYSG